jgi:hypothetical protein
MDAGLRAGWRVRKLPKTMAEAVAHIESLRYFRKRSVIAVERALRQWAAEAQGVGRG